MQRIVRTMAAALGLAASLVFCAQVAAAEAEEPAKKPTRVADCVYVPTPNDVTAKMLEMAEIKKSDLVYDLGCGDGRIVITAAKRFGCKAVGYEINADLVAEAIQNAKKRKVDDLVQIKQEDIFTLDLSKANVITLYLLPGMLTKLTPQLEKLKPGARIVVHDYPISGVKADKSVTLLSNEDNVKHTIYLYTLPLKKEAQEE